MSEMQKERAHCQSLQVNYFQRIVRTKRGEERKKGKPRATTHHLESEVVEMEEYQMFTLTSGSRTWKVSPIVEGVSLPVEIDTGSAVLIISEHRWKNELRGTTLRPSSAVLKTVTGETVRLLGELDVQVEHNNQKVCLPLIVMKAGEWSFVARTELDRGNSDGLAQGTKTVPFRWIGGTLDQVQGFVQGRCRYRDRI